MFVAAYDDSGQQTVSIFKGQAAQKIMPGKIRCVVREGTKWTTFGTGTNRLPFVKLPSGRKRKIQSAGGRKTPENAAE